MVQGYYTLEESANLLGMSPDDLKQLARKGEIRSFQDRGTWRFRIQDIQEMARRRGDSIQEEISVGDSLAPKLTDSPAPRTPGPKKKSGDAFGLSLDPGDVDAGVNLDAAVDLGAPGSGKKTGSGKHSPQVGSDSDVRLVADGSDVNFRLPGDSDVKIEGIGPKSGRAGKPGGSGSGKSPRPSKAKPDQASPEAADSGARLVSMESDSDVRIVGADSDHTIHVPIGEQLPKGATDSDVKLEGHTPTPRRGENEGMLTEEINLDEELKKDESRRHQMKQAKHRPAAPEPPKKSPFELSESDIELAPLGEAQAAGKVTDSSSDFDVGSSRVDLQACKLEYSIVSPK